MKKLMLGKCGELFDDLRAFKEENKEDLSLITALSCVSNQTECPKRGKGQTQKAYERVQHSYNNYKCPIKYIEAFDQLENKTDFETFNKICFSNPSFVKYLTTIKELVLLIIYKGQPFTAQNEAFIRKCVLVATVYNAFNGLVKETLLSDYINTFDDLECFEADNEADLKEKIDLIIRQKGATEGIKLQLKTPSFLFTDYKTLRDNRLATINKLNQTEKSYFIFLDSEKEGVLAPSFGSSLIDPKQLLNGEIAPHSVNDSNFKSLNAFIGEVRAVLGQMKA